MNYQRREMIWRNLKCILLSLEWTSPIKLEKCETPWASLRSTLNLALNRGYISSRWSGSNWTTTFFEVGVLYCMACGRLNLCSQQWQCRVLTSGPSGKSLNCLRSCFSLSFIHAFVFGCCCVRAFSLVSGGCSSLCCASFSLWWPLVVEHRL